MFNVIRPDELTVTPMTGKPAVKITVEYGDGDSANVILTTSQAQTLALALTAALASPLLDFAHTNPWAGEDS